MEADLITHKRPATRNRLVTGRRGQSLPGHKGLFHALALWPDDKLLAPAGRDGGLNLWDFPTGKILATREEGAFGFQAVAFSPAGKTLATGGFDRHSGLGKVDDLLTDNRPR